MKQGIPVKISVIIPTRERSDVLKGSLQTAISQNYDNLEILVSDNCSNDDTEKIVRETGDSRVKYLNTGKRLSMSHNWEFALSHVNEGWVTIIGDDDGLLPGSVGRVAEMISSTNVRAIRSRVCSYKWPSMTGKPFGKLGVPMQTGSEIRNAGQWLMKVLNGESTYLELPLLYNGGYVCRTVLNEIQAKTGAIYRSCIPDVYSAISISSIIDKYLFLDEPLAINGASKHSTGTSYFGDSKPARDAPVNKFASEPNIPFHKDLPLYADGKYPASIQVLVYESYLQSMPLRPPIPHQDIRATQVALILATSGTHETQIEEWSLAFCRLHNLDFRAIKSHAIQMRRKLKLSSLWSTCVELTETWGAGSMEIPIANVYDASLVADSIVNSKPGKFRNVMRLARRAVDRLRSSA